jgi:hypothetical protein
LALGKRVRLCQRLGAQAFGQLLLQRGNGGGGLDQGLHDADAAEPQHGHLEFLLLTQFLELLDGLLKRISTQRTAHLTFTQSYRALILSGLRI